MKKAERETIVREVNIAWCEYKKAQIAALIESRDPASTPESCREAQLERDKKEAFYNGMDYLASMTGVNVDLDRTSRELDARYWDLFFNPEKVKKSNSLYIDFHRFIHSLWKIFPRRPNKCFFVKLHKRTYVLIQLLSGEHMFG